MAPKGGRRLRQKGNKAASPAVPKQVPDSVARWGLRSDSVVALDAIEDHPARPTRSSKKSPQPSPTDDDKKPAALAIHSRRIAARSKMEQTETTPDAEVIDVDKSGISYGTGTPSDPIPPIAASTLKDPPAYSEQVTPVCPVNLSAAMQSMQDVIEFLDSPALPILRPA